MAAVIEHWVMAPRSTGQTVKLRGHWVCCFGHSVGLTRLGQMVAIAGQAVVLDGQTVCRAALGQRVCSTGQNVGLEGHWVGCCGQKVGPWGQEVSWVTQLVISTGHFVKI